MKLFKKILIGLLILVALILILAYFLPRELQVKVGKTVDAPANYVYNYLNDLNNNEEWDPWARKDETMTMTMGDKTVGEGASYSWDSENSGSGTLTVQSVSANEKIVSTIESPQMGNVNVVYEFIPENKDKSELVWDFQSTTSWPMNIMNYFIIPSIKSEFEDGIDNINEVVSERYTKGIYYGQEVKQELIEEKNYIINRAEVPLDKIQQFYTQNLGPLFQKIQKANVEMEGKPSGLFYSYNEKKGISDMAAGIPIAEMVNIADANSEVLPPAKAAVVDFYGDFSKTEIAHYAIDAYLRDRELHHDYPIVEEYVTDPSEVTDPDKWLTRVVYYLSE